MASLKLVYVFTVLALCAVMIGAERSFSITSSTSLQYEVDAIECLQEAYVLYPDNTDNKLLDAFSKLFGNRHKITGGWNVAMGCEACYNPKATQYVELVVHDDNVNTPIKIFN